MWHWFKAYQHGFSPADTLLFNYRGFGNGFSTAGVGVVMGGFSY